MSLTVFIKDSNTIKPTNNTLLFVEGVGATKVSEMQERISQILASIANGILTQDDDALLYLEESMSKGSELFKLVEGLKAANEYIRIKRICYGY